MSIQRWFVLIVLGLFFACVGVVSADNSPTDASRAVNNFAFTQWTTVANDPLHPTQIFTGDFDGDGYDDLMTYVPVGVGPISVALNNGSNGFNAPTQWTDAPPSAGNWQIIPGNFIYSNDPMVVEGHWMDIALYNPSNGNIWVGRSNRIAFTYSTQPWATVSPVAGWHFSEGAFEAPSLYKRGLAGYLASTGQIWIGRNRNVLFQFDATPWATVTPVANWQFTPGYIDADDQVDLAGYYPNGTIWQLLKQAGSSFVSSQLSSVSPDDGWTIESGQFVDGQRTELMATRNDGNIWIGQCNGTFTFSIQGTVTPPTGWIYRTGDFNADLRTDVLAYYPATGGVWVALNPGLTAGVDCGVPTAIGLRQNAATPAFSAPQTLFMLLILALASWLLLRRATFKLDNVSGFGNPETLHMR